MKKILLLTLALLVPFVAPQAFCQKLIDLIPLESPPSQNIAVNPVTGNIYVALDYSNQVAVVDGSSGTVAYITVGSAPSVVAVNPATNRVYVMNLGGSQSTMMVIDGSNNQIVDTFNISGGYVMAVDPARNLIYFHNGADSVISVLNGLTNEIIATIPTFNQNSIPESIAVNPITNRIYVSAIFFSQTPTSIAVIDGASRTTVDVVALPSTCNGAVIDVDQTLNRLYVSACEDLYVLNGRTNQWAKTIIIPAGQGSSLAVDQTTHMVALFTVSDTLNLLDFFNGSTFAMVGQVSFSPYELAYAIGANSSSNGYYLAISGNAKKGAVAVVSGP